ncbi:membrane fusion protein, multidrug efflux system [Hymenobacter gelipurpurascens]|uniref:Membrane fusion protein, multidrug efflux system n=1 Tax=Hymenobacter gelipurpurascens TaxID=89968 RepID=A0A212THU6_9BACT|nr:HlyD family secretion protein [Hymenobacter gelipurpurascens]SNC65424.1 membrane fusion protein, multidrug efflux system [Hymenobacter gelipurpurascens]
MIQPTTSPQHPAQRTDRLVARITSTLAGLLVLVLLIWAGRIGWSMLHYESTDDAQVEEYINPINSKVSGYIRQIHYQENQAVKAGDTLVVLDDRDFELPVAEAEAALANAQAQLLNLARTVQTSQRSSQVSQSQIGAAKARLVQQEQDFARYHQLLADEAVTRQQFERVQSALDVARSDYQALAGGYQTALSRVNESQGQRAVLQAEIRRRQALLRKARLDLSYTIVTAPYAGVMGRQTIQEGQLMQAGQPLAYIVNRQAGKWITANFKETQLPRLHVGQPVRIITDAYPDQVFAGRIESLSPATGARFSLLPPDNATGNFIKVIQRLPIRIHLTDQPAKIAQLAAGMNATVTVAK